MGEHGPAPSSSPPPANSEAPAAFGGYGKHRLVLGLGLLALVPLVVLAAVVYRENLVEETAAAEIRLTELAAVREAWVETHLEGRAGTIAQLANRTGLRHDFRRAVIEGDSSALPGLEESLVDASEAEDVLGIALFDSRGREVVSVGMSSGLMLDSIALARARAVPPLVRVDAAAVEPGLVEVILQPVVEEGQELGFVELVYGGGDLLSIGSSFSGLGETGEVLMGVRDRAGKVRFIGPVRFRENAPFTPVDGDVRLPIHEAIAGTETYFEDLTDYRGERVFAATRHIEGPSWGLVVKMDRSEALSAVSAMGRTLLVGGGSIGVMMIVFAWWIARGIRRGEDALLESRRRVAQTRDELSATLFATPMPLFTLDSGGRVQRWSAAAEEVFGWSAEEARGRILPPVPEDDLPRFHELRRRILDGDTIEGVELLRRRKDKSSIPVRAYGAPIVGSDGTIHGIVGLLEDVREEKEREQSLRVTNRALRFVSASNMAVVRNLDREDLLDRVCSVALEEGGYAHVWIALGEGDGDGELHQSGRGGVSLDLREEEALVDEIARASEVGVAFVSQGLRADGEEWERRLAALGYGSLAALPLDRPSSNGAFVALAHVEASAFDAQEIGILNELVRDLAYGLDVARVRRNLFLVQEAVASLSTGVCILDAGAPEHPIIFANAALSRVTGYSRDETRAAPWDFCLAPDAEPEDVRRLTEALAERRSEQVTVRGLRKSGHPFWDRLTLNPIRTRDETVTHFVALHEDVTEERERRAELSHRARLAAVGELAGGVAHDFRNILGASQGLIHLALGTDDLPAETRSCVEELKTVLDRGRSITERLLAFSRRRPVEQRVVSLRMLMESVTTVVDHTLRDDVGYSLEMPEGERVQLFVDPDEFVHLMLNLIRNAEQAMPRGGQLSVECEVLASEPSMEGWPGDVAFDGDDPWLLVTVEDTGVGMDEETRERAFDPYFTTKPAGEGTGLGLPAVFSGVEAVGGRVWIRSRLGEGTAVHVLLPTTSESESRVGSPGVPRRDEPAETAVGTVLFAEDDETLRRVLSRAMERAGHTIVSAADGRAAIEAFEARPDDIDLVVTDGVMPRASGADLAEAVWSRRPQVPVVVTSGFGSGDLRSQFPAETEAPLVFLPKPFEVSELLELLRELIPEGRARRA